MSFLMFKILFAALALGLLVVVVLVARQIVSKRQPSEPELPNETASQAPKLQMPRLGRKAPEPEPEPEEAASAPARRRQLQSFADAEKSAAEAETVVLPVAMVPETEVAADDDMTFVTEPGAESGIAAEEPETEAEVALAEPEAELETSEPHAPDYNETVLGRLEEAFEALQEGELTLDAYRARIQGEYAAVEGHIAALKEAGDDTELEVALTARDSVLWCLDWAEEQASALG